MKNRKMWISIAAVALFLIAALFYLNYRNRTFSPPGSETLTSGGITVTVDYSRPSVRGRIIFGTEDQQALQPYGEYWRLGANEATKISFNRDILFNGDSVKAGTYRMYAFPGATSFEVRLNAEDEGWGAGEPDYEKDILSTQVPVEKTGSPVEQFTISLAPSGGGMDMVFEWSDTRFVVPIKAQ